MKVGQTDDDPRGAFLPFKFMSPYPGVAYKLDLKKLEVDNFGGVIQFFDDHTQGERFVACYDRRIWEPTINTDLRRGSRS